VHVYASDEIARKLIALPKGSRVRVSAVFVYGATKEVESGEDGAVTKNEEHSGVRAEDVLDIAPPDAEEAS